MIAIDQSLAGVTSLGFDTSPFIYLVERAPKYLTCVRDLFGRVDRGELVSCTSAITLTEVLTLPKKLQQVELQQQYRQLLTGSRNLRLVAITAEVADVAATIRARYNLRTPDALQVAAAIHEGCQAFVCNDRDLKRIQEVRVLLLDELAS